VKSSHFVISGLLNDYYLICQIQFKQKKKSRFLVLDEADRMLDMGFEPQVRQLVEQESNNLLSFESIINKHTLIFKIHKRYASDQTNIFIFCNLTKTHPNFSKRISI